MREDQLERSLRAAAPRVATGGVLDRVAHKRARRRTVRRAELGAVAFVLVAALSMVVVLAREEDDVSRVAAGGSSTARVITGDAAVTPTAGAARAPVPITLDPDQGYVRGPLVVTGSTLSIAAYEHDGSTFTYPPSRIVRLDGRTYHEEGRTDLKAEILSIADSTDARWVVTRNPPPPNGLPDAFLKRIAANGTVVSTLLPPGTDVVGPLAVGAGAVWIPVRDGVLRYDPAVDRVTSRVDLPPADSRAVLVEGDAVWVTAGREVRSLDPGGVVLPMPTGSPQEEVVGLAPDGGGSFVALVRNTATGSARVGDLELPRGFSATAIRSAERRVWVEGTAGGSPAVVLLDAQRGIRSTVVLSTGRDASFAWVSDDTVLAVSNGMLLRINVRT